MIVHIKPSTTDGRPSTISLAFMLTSFIWKCQLDTYFQKCPESNDYVLKLLNGIKYYSLTFFPRRNSIAVLQLLRKCGLRSILPFSTGSFSPDKTSSRWTSLDPSLRSSNKFSTLSGGVRYLFRKNIHKEISAGL